VTTSRSPQAKAAKCRSTGRATTKNKSKPSGGRERHLKSQSRTPSGGLTAFSWGYPYGGHQCGAVNVASVRLPTSPVRGCQRLQRVAANISSVGLSKRRDETRPHTTVHSIHYQTHGCRGNLRVPRGGRHWPVNPHVVRLGPRWWGASCAEGSSSPLMFSCDPRGVATGRTQNRPAGRVTLAASSRPTTSLATASDQM